MADESGLERELLPDVVPATIEEAMASDPFGLLKEEGEEIFEVEHVSSARTSPQSLARRRPAEDFSSFEQLFVDCQEDLRVGRRRLVPFRKPSEIAPAMFFVLAGVLLYVADIRPLRPDRSRKANARTRCIFENGSEADLLMQSLASGLYRDGSRVTGTE